jgi:hypothetical protein
MSTMSASKYLEDLQRRAYEAVGISSDQIILERARLLGLYAKNPLDFFSSETLAGVSPRYQTEFADSSIDTLRKLKEIKLPTRYEDPLFYQLMLELSDNIREALNFLYKGDTRSNVTLPLFGTLPMGDINARSISLSMIDEYLLVFEDQLFVFCNLLSKLLAIAFPIKSIRQVQGRRDPHVTFSTDYNDIEKNISENKQIQQRFQELVLAYLLKGRPSSAPRYLLDRQYVQRAFTLRRSMELFILGHEYGHVIFNHHKDPPVVSNIGGQKVNEIKHSWMQEFEADSLGLVLTIAALKQHGIDFYLSCEGAELFFSAIDIISRGRSIINTGQEENRSKDTGSHPPPANRRMTLRELVKRLYGDRAADLGIIVEKTINKLWEKTRPALYEQYQIGQMLDPRWQHA